MTIPSLKEALHFVNQDRLETLLIDIIDIYSPSFGEHKLLAHLVQWLDRHQFTYTRQHVSGELYNLIISVGKPDPSLFMLGHIDTIPRHHRTDHRAKRVEDQIEGLGASDMKSGVAAMLEAFLALQEAGYPSDAPGVGLALLVDEETDGTGSAAFLNSYSPQMAIIGEPTDLRLCGFHYSYCELHLLARGKRVHSAIPEHGHNAIIDLMDLIRKIYQQAPPPDLETSDWCFPNLRSLQGENLDFTVPDTCEAYLDIHLHPDVVIPEYAQSIDTLVTSHNQAHELSDISHKWTLISPGCRLPPQSPLMQLGQQAAEELNLSLDVHPFRSHSDANVLAEHGINTLVVGPGALETAHTAHETVSTEELHQAAQLYLSMILAHARNHG